MQLNMWIYWVKLFFKYKHHISEHIASGEEKCLDRECEISEAIVFSLTEAAAIVYLV